MDNELKKSEGAPGAKLTESLAAKVGAFILLVVFTAFTVISVLGVCLLLADDYYSRRPDDLKEELLGSFVWEDAQRLCQTLENSGVTGFSPEAVLGETNLTCHIEKNGATVYGNRDTKQSCYLFEEDDCYTIVDENGSHSDYTADIYINKDFPVNDKYALAAKASDTLYALRYWLYVIAVAEVIACIVLFVFLMAASGHRRGRPGISGSFVTKIPFDLLLTAGIFAMYMVYAAAVEASYYVANLAAVIICCLAIAICYCLFIGLCIDFAARAKTGKWWRNTIIYMVLRLIWRILKAMGRAIAYALSRLPLIWKTVLGLILLGILGLFCIMFDDGASRLTMLFFVGLAIAAGVIYVALVLRKLQYAGRKIAEGDLSYRVDTSKMLWDLKEHGENLNSIGLGMTRAVDERMKSERLKTELITNVSHDIKTPLTSIINYVDLISKEESGNGKIDEYVSVLSRQSERLKKLIEDLVEASKASTGNVDVALAPCDAGVLVTQTAGEYEEKLKAGALEVIVNAPETPLMVMADGRLLSRVFDNLIGNVCKYAQPDTRVYISAERVGGEAVIALKNISKYPLNIKADELLERFVRGDASRSTEGSGLGLSIAKSLTELMGGRFELMVDGDLFKVALCFKAVS